MNFISIHARRPRRRAVRAAVALAAVAGAQGTWYYGYQVTSEADLAQVGAVCGLGSTYMLTNDITMTPPAPGSGNHTPIGSVGSPFTGYFHGQGYAIDGLVIDADGTDDVGFFAAMGSWSEVGEISFTNASVSGRDRVGIVAGSATFVYPHDVTVQGSVNGDDEVGGFFGAMSNGRLSKIDADVTVTGVGTTGKVGGLVGTSGWNLVSGPGIEDADVTSTVTSAGSDVGGVVGWAVEGFDFQGSLDVVTSVDAAGDNAGGLVGSSRGTIGATGVEFNSAVPSMSVIGDVTSAGSNAGGVFGTAGVLLAFPRFDVTVDVTMTGSGVTGGGGFAGSMRNAALFGGVSFTGTVDAPGASLVGGFAGLQRGLIDLGPTTVTGSVTGSGEVGGLAGAFGPGGNVSKFDSAVSVTGTTNVGGLVGTLDGTPFDLGGYTGVVSGVRIGSSKSTGTVAGTTNVGGLAGRTLDVGVVIDNSYFDGSITATTNVGGLVGLADTEDGAGDTTVTNSYVLGTALLPGSADPLIGSVQADTTLSTNGLMFHTELTGKSTSDHGVGGDSTTLTDVDTFTAAEWSIVEGWAASGYSWGICGPVNDGHPFLTWEIGSATDCLEAPTWTDDSIGSMRLGEEFSDGVGATGSEPITYAVTAGALPEGVSLDEATGAITGTPSAVGDYDVTITASNAAGSVDVRLTGTVTADDPDIDIALDFGIGADIGNGDQTTSVRGKGLRPNSSFRVVLRSDPVEIGSGVADANGEFEAVLTIPANTPYGAHSATVYGTAPDGSEVQAVSYFTLDENGIVLAVSEQTPTPEYSPELPSPTTPGPVVVPTPQLPATGSDVGLMAVAGLFLLSGALLTLVLRRGRGQQSRLW